MNIRVLRVSLFLCSFFSHLPSQQTTVSVDLLSLMDYEVESDDSVFFSYTISNLCAVG